MKLAACMIVKDEEHNLPRCLDSIKSVVDEIVILDTGSTDRTMEIAREYGAQVHEWPWNGSFSDARNEAMKYLPLDADWWLQIDADEELHPGLKVDVFRKELGNVPEDIHALTVTMKDKNRKGEITCSFQAIRLFRHNRGVYFQFAVHNDPVIPWGHGAPTDVIIFHYGYDLDPEAKLKKFHRMKAALDMEDQGLTRTQYYLSTMWFEVEDWIKAIHHGREALDLYVKGRLYDDSDLRDFYIFIYVIVAVSFLRLGAVGQAFSWVDKGLKINPDDIDLNFLKAKIGKIANERGHLESGATKYLELLKEYKVNPHLAAGRLVLYTDKNVEKEVRRWLEAA